MTTLKPFGPMAHDGLRCTLGDLNMDVCAALAEAFAKVDGVEVVHGNLVELACDAIVSPANSFGDMGGGIDKAIDDFHGGEAQRRLMEAIARHFLGELPVGAALMLELTAKRFMVAAPTMRIPGNVSGSINAYLAMRAALVAVLNHNSSGGRPIRTLAIPGLCTGIGGMDFRQAARQMRAAYDSIIAGKWRDVTHAVQAPFATNDG